MSLSCAAEISPQQSHLLPRAGQARRIGEPMTDSYVYKDAVTHSADNAVANKPTGFSHCARGTLTRRLLRTCLRNYLPTLPAPRGAARGDERGTAADPEGDARSGRAPYALDAPDGTTTRANRGGGDADFEELSGRLRAGSRHRAGFLNAR